MIEQLGKYKDIEIESRIFLVKGIHVMIDRDLAEMYEVETKVLNQAVKRNINRFPDTFRFQLSENEIDKLVTICDRLRSIKHSSVLPFAFTEQGVAMLASVLRSERAVQISIQIINTFVEMRKLISSHLGLFQRMDRLEIKQIEQDYKFEMVLNALESGREIKEQGVFFEGQIFDAYTFVSDIIRSANKSIQLIDNYVDDSVLLLLAKRKNGVQATIYSKSISKILELDSVKHNAQYDPIDFKKFELAHDRFLIIDENVIYHIGASLKDLGKKWFAFSIIKKDALSIFDRLSHL